METTVANSLCRLVAVTRASSSAVTVDPSGAVRSKVCVASSAKSTSYPRLPPTRAVVCGITTNHCCETTARVGGNLGYDVLFALDATHTFDRTAPDGSTVSADELARVTATNLHGEFATVVSTADLVDDEDASAPETPRIA